MDRQVLDTLYLGSLGRPQRIFDRAVSESPLGRDSYGFLVDHADELDVPVIIKLFNATPGKDVEFDEVPFVRRLTQLVPSAGVSEFLDVLKLSAKISPAAWIHFLAVPLKTELEPYKWHRLVYKSRGGDLFNALNTGMPAGVDRELWDPDEMMAPLQEAKWPEPLVASLLDVAHNDLAVAAFALKTIPLVELLWLHERFPTLIRIDEIKEVAQSRVESKSEMWIPSPGGPPLPEWMAPLVAERLRHCENTDEAAFLYDWLFALPPGSHKADPYELAVLRFKMAISADPKDFETFQTHQRWHPIIGSHLTTGTAWKNRGRDFVALCLDVGKGLPTDVLKVALESSTAKDGADADEHRESILRKVHDVTAKLLVERAEIAIKAGDFVKGDLFLSAFISLEPGSFIKGALHGLKRIPNLPPDLVVRINGCEALAGSGGRAPSVDGFSEAGLVLTRQKL